MLLVCAMIGVGLTVSSQKFRSTVKFSLGTVHRQRSKQVKTWDKQCTGNVNFRLLFFLLSKGILMFWQFKTSTFYTIWNSPWLALFCCRSSPVQRPMHCKRKCWLVEFGWQQYAYALQKIRECLCGLGISLFGTFMVHLCAQSEIRPWSGRGAGFAYDTVHYACWQNLSSECWCVISWDLFKGMITILVYYNRYIYRYKYIDIY